MIMGSRGGRPGGLRTGSGIASLIVPRASLAASPRDPGVTCIHRPSSPRCRGHSPVDPAPPGRPAPRERRCAQFLLARVRIVEHRFQRARVASEHSAKPCDDLLLLEVFTPRRILRTADVLDHSEVAQAQHLARTALRSIVHVASTRRMWATAGSAREPTPTAAVIPVCSSLHLLVHRTRPTARRRIRRSGFWVVRLYGVRPTTAPT
jgi:hypothetical protein